jgi:AraC family transcriptional regulator, arabinose operon regulatory protein
MGFYASPPPEDRRFLTIDSTGVSRMEPRPTRFRREHGWRSHQLMYTLSGQGVGDVEGQPFAAREHTVTLLPADRNHGYQPAEGCRVWAYQWIEFGGEMAPELLRLYGLQNRWHVDNCREAWPMVEEIVALLESEGNTALHEAAGLFLRVLAVVERCAGAGRGRPPMMRQIDQAARHFMADHLHEQISLEDIAQAVRSSPYHLIRVFKRNHNQTPMACLRQLRAERAKALLVRGDLSIKEVGQRVGYPLPPHFSRMFKAETGSSPRAFVRSRAAHR